MSEVRQRSEASIAKAQPAPARPIAQAVLSTASTIFSPPSLSALTMAS